MHNQQYPLDVGEPLSHFLHPPELQSRQLYTSEHGTHSPNSGWTTKLSKQTALFADVPGALRVEETNTLRKSPPVPPTCCCVSYTTKQPGVNFVLPVQRHCPLMQIPLMLQLFWQVGLD